MAGIVNIMGIPVNIIKETELISLMKSYISDDEMNIVYMVSVDTFKALSADESLAEDIKASDIILPGEKAVMSSSHGKKIKGVVNSYKYLIYLLRMPDLFKKVCVIGEDVKSTLALSELFARQNSELDICGSYSLDAGYNDETVINDINSMDLDLLIMMVSSPRMEKWIVEHRAKIYAKVLIGVGGVSDVMLKQYKKPAGWIVKLGLADAFYDMRNRNYSDNRKKERIMHGLIAEHISK